MERLRQPELNRYYLELKIVLNTHTHTHSHTSIPTRYSLFLQGFSNKIYQKLKFSFRIYDISVRDTCT